MKNETKQARVRLNALDWTLLVLAFFSLLLAAGYLVLRREREQNETRITVVMLLSGIVREEMADALPSVDSSVRSENGSSVLGRVISVSQKPHLRAVLRDGRAVLEEDAERMDLEITVSMSGQRREGEGIRVQDLRIAAGGKGNFRFGSVFASGVEILSVEVER